jgi:hypothetical protein
MNAQRLETIGRLLGTLWGVIGPLVGVVIGAWLRSRQHKSQLPQNKRPNYRELSREDWERLQNVLVKMARENRVIPNDIIGSTLSE